MASLAARGRGSGPEGLTGKPGGARDAQYGNYGGDSLGGGKKWSIPEAAQELAQRKHKDSRFMATKYDARGLGSTEAGGWLEDEYTVAPRAHVDRAEAAEKLAAAKHAFPWGEPGTHWSSASTHANQSSEEPARGYGKRLYKPIDDAKRPQVLPPLMPRLQRPGRRSPTLNLFAGTPSYEPRAGRHRGAQQSSVFSAGEGKAYDYIDRKKHPRLYENAYKKLNSTVFSQHGGAGGGGGGAGGGQPPRRKGGNRRSDSSQVSQLMSLASAAAPAPSAAPAPRPREGYAFPLL